MRLHVVTGKGGTGKSTVAAALALALATSGRNVLLCEVEGRQGIARMFDVDPLPYEERRIAKGAPDRDGRAGQVYALHIDPESALLEYLSMYYKLGRAGKALDRFGVIDFATTIAPGVRDVLLTGKVYEAVQRPRGGRHKDADHLRRRGARRAAHRPDLPVPRRQLRAGRPRQGGPDQDPGRQDDGAAALAAHGRAPRHDPRGDARPGDLGRRSPSCARAGLPVGGVVVNLVRPQDLSPSALAQVRDDTVDPTAVDLRADPRPGRRRRRPGAARSSPRPATTPYAVSSRTSSASSSRPSACRPTSCRASPSGIDQGALVELAQLLRHQGMA